MASYSYLSGKQRTVAEVYDILILNGTVYDGSGQAPRRVDCQRLDSALCRRRWTRYTATAGSGNYCRWHFFPCHWLEPDPRRACAGQPPSRAGNRWPPRCRRSSSEKLRLSWDLCGSGRFASPARTACRIFSRFGFGPFLFPSIRREWGYWKSGHMPQIASESASLPKGDSTEPSECLN